MMKDHTGSALISNSQLYKVSCLLYPPGHWSPNYNDTDGYRLFDLFTLIEALVMNEKLVTLPGLSDSDVVDKNVRKYNIVKTLPTDVNADVDIGKLLVTKMKDIASQSCPLSVMVNLAHMTNC